MNRLKNLLININLEINRKLNFEEGGKDSIINDDRNSNKCDSY